MLDILGTTGLLAAAITWIYVGFRLLEDLDYDPTPARKLGVAAYVLICCAVVATIMHHQHR